MTHHCNKCKREYEDSDGSFYDGHDYCLNCLTFIKSQKIEQDRRQREHEEQRRILQEQAQRRSLARSYEEGKLAIRREEEIRQHAAQQQRERQEEEERKKLVVEQRKQEEKARRETGLKDQHEAARIVMAQKLTDELYKRKVWYDEDEKTQQKKKIVFGKGAKKEERKKLEKCPICGTTRGKLERACKACGKSYEKPEQLHLEAQKGLPVSLSLGQGNVSINLMGSNPANKSITVDLITLMMDAKQHSMSHDVAPRTATIPAASRTGFQIKFDVAVDAPLGTMTFTGYLQYPEGRSNAISLISNIKTPIDLKYKKDSAHVGGKLDNFIELVFDNIGDSGGIIAMSSKITFSTNTGEIKSAPLSAAVKVKGQEKGITLSFGPTTQGVKFEKISYVLIGVDTNGKAYKTKGAIGGGVDAPDENDGEGSNTKAADKDLDL